MQVWNGLDEVPADLGRTVVTIGNFDGVHRGHVEVLRSIATQAAELGVTSVAVTFSPHPRAVHQPEDPPVLLASLEQRLELMEATGLDAVLVIEYTLDFARQSPRAFVESCFVAGLHAARVVVGHDVRFGWGNEGTLATLETLGGEHGFDVVAIADLGLGGDRWSSTSARRLLQDGDVARAALVLGRQHRVRSSVVHGDARGRTIGFPTANLGWPIEGLVPADGVYAGWLLRGEVDAQGRVVTPADRRLPAAISIGTNPTFAGVERRVEAYVLDRTDLELYGERVELELVAHLRPTLRFDSVEALVTRMHEDVERCREVLRAP